MAENTPAAAAPVVEPTPAPAAAAAPAEGAAAEGAVAAPANGAVAAADGKPGVRHVSQEEMKKMLESGDKKLVRILPDRADTWHPAVVNPNSFPGLVAGLKESPDSSKFMTSCAFLESAAMSPQHRLLLRNVPDLKKTIEEALEKLGTIEEGKIKPRLYSLIHSSLLLAWKLKNDLEAAQECSVALEDPPLINMGDAEANKKKFLEYLDTVWSQVRVLGVDKDNKGAPPKDMGTPEEKNKLMLATDVERRLNECIQCKKSLEGVKQTLMRLSIHPRIPSLFLPVLSCLECPRLGSENSKAAQDKKVEAGEGLELWDEFEKKLPAYYICRQQAENQAMRMLRKAHIPKDFIPRWTSQKWKMCEDDLCPRCNLDVSPSKRLLELELTSLRCSVCHKKMESRGVPTRHFDRANYPADLVHCGTRYVCSQECQVNHSKLIAEQSKGNLKPSDVLKKASDTAPCGGCGKADLKTNLKLCNGCQDTYYCGRECQVKAWKSGHKLECKQKQAQRALDQAKKAKA